LFLKGARCATDKCAFTRRSYPSGQHGASRGKGRSKVSDYGLQLREKQKVKRIYGVLERQFRRYFYEADRLEGVTGELLLQLLERRLDNVILRSGFAVSLTQARQFVRYGHVQVNGKKVDIPSFMVVPGLSIQMKAKPSVIKLVNENLEITKSRTIPSWLKIDTANLKSEVIKLPLRDEVPFAVQEQLIVELYSK